MLDAKAFLAPEVLVLAGVTVALLAGASKLKRLSLKALGAVSLILFIATLVDRVYPYTPLAFIAVRPSIIVWAYELEGPPPLIAYLVPAGLLAACILAWLIHPRGRKAYKALGIVSTLLLAYLVLYAYPINYATWHLTRSLPNFAFEFQTAMEGSWLTVRSASVTYEVLREEKALLPWEVGGFENPGEMLPMFGGEKIARYKTRIVDEDAHTGRYSVKIGADEKGWLWRYFYMRMGALKIPFDPDLYSKARIWVKIVKIPEEAKYIAVYVRDMSMSPWDEKTETPGGARTYIPVSRIPIGEWFPIEVDVREAFKKEEVWGLYEIELLFDVISDKNVTTIPFGFRPEPEERMIREWLDKCRTGLLGYMDDFNFVSEKGVPVNRVKLWLTHPISAGAGSLYSVTVVRENGENITLVPPPINERQLLSRTLQWFKTDFTINPAVLKPGERVKVVVIVYFPLWRGGYQPETKTVELTVQG